MRQVQVIHFLPFKYSAGLVYTLHPLSTFTKPLFLLDLYTDGEK